MASLTDRFKYDVFLSFRGEDTRHGFTGYLKKALDDKGVRTFVDEKDLQKGDKITPSLLKAIEGSMMAIVVLSKNYASSSFCLQELSHILDSLKDKGRSVLPVFYKVDPSVIRKLEKTYGEAMAKHKASSNLDKWKVSLHQVANLSGFHYKGNVYEHEFIGKIVEKVLKNLNPITLPVGDYLVGLEHQKQHVTSLLNVGSDDTVHMVGIHGIGGIGKTTLALEVYNSIVRQFQGSCFLEKVRENSDKNGLIYLQKLLLSQIVGEENITSVGQGISILQQRLHQKKVLLLLDDVDNLEQLEAIAGKSIWFGPGSRVIVTTRDKRLLTRHKIERTYEVKGLNDEDAFDLVGWKALQNEYSRSYKDILSVQKYGRELMDVKDKVFLGYANVLKRAVAYACGLPLALEVIGSHFFNKTIEECKCALDRYERVPDKKIQTTLQLSFNALEEDEKSVFLDIACCFKGWKLTRVEEILHAHHGDIMKDHINVLVEKSLIKVSESGNVTLHDLVEDMGKEIVRQESPENPGKRSRLWSSNDIIQVLEENTGTSKIEIIHFDRCIRVEWDGEAFRKMENLKTLIFSNDVFFTKNPKHLPSSLRVLECCYRKYPSSDFHARDDRCHFFIHPPSTPFEWKGFLTKKFQKMRVLNLDNIDLLARIPDISGLPNLEEFSIQNGKELIAIDKSVGFLGKLKILRLISCTNIRSVPPLSLASLEVLQFSRCLSLESFPLIVSGFVGKLKILRVTKCTKIRIIPSLKLPSLEELDLSYCSNLESFPCVVDGLLDKLKFLNIECCMRLRNIPRLRFTSLEHFNLSYCNSLKSFPELLGEMRNIPGILLDETPRKDLPFPFESLMLFANVKELHLTNNQFTVIPKSIEKCHFLWKLVLDDCKELHEIQGIPPCLRMLSALNCISLTSLCKSKLLNQELHEAGNTWFRLPLEKIPEWFDHQYSEGLSISFWFRNKFPAIALGVVSALTWDSSQNCTARVIINNNNFFYALGSKIDAKSRTGMYHLHLFHMQMENFNGNMDKALLENKWNHAEVDFGFKIHNSGIHVLKEKSNVKDIRFTNPENDPNIVLRSRC